MKKTSILIAILAAMPSYFALFCAPHWAATLLVISTILGVGLSASIDTKKEYWLMDRFRFGWIIHLLGICAVVAYHNIA